MFNISNTYTKGAVHRQARAQDRDPVRGAPGRGAVHPQGGARGGEYYY